MAKLLSRLTGWTETRHRAGDRVIVVAVHKSGTNLISRLLENLGYRVTGEGIDNRRPDWSSSFDASFLRKFPARTAYFTHAMPLHDIPRSLAEEWVTEHEPRILFHYRDPRAVLASFVNYLMKRNAGRGHSAAGYQTMLSDLLAQVPSAEHIATVMAACPQYIRKGFEDNLWLLHHSAVCKTSFEDLVGPAGGGATAAQIETMDRVAEFLGQPRPERGVAARLFDRDARTFCRGQVDGWQESFRAEDLVMFERLYGAILDAYGYSRASEPLLSSPERTIVSHLGAAHNG
jgi:hypothetical protein